MTHNEKHDAVNHPQHYTNGGIECIDAIAAATGSLEGAEAFCTGNAIKYLWRWKHKNGTEDLRKARWYIDRLIKATAETEAERDNNDSMTIKGHGANFGIVQTASGARVVDEKGWLVYHFPPEWENNRVMDWFQGFDRGLGYGRNLGRHEYQQAVADEFKMFIDMHKPASDVDLRPYSMQEIMEMRYTKVWVEFRNKPHAWDGWIMVYYAEPCLIKVSRNGIRIKEYGVAFRFWPKKPTESQTKAIPWDS